MPNDADPSVGENLSPWTVTSTAGGLSNVFTETLGAVMNHGFSIVDTRRIFEEALSTLRRTGAISGTWTDASTSTDIIYPSPVRTSPMPRRLQIDDQLFGYVLNEQDVHRFNTMATAQESLTQVIDGARTEVARYDGRITSLERQNAAMSERIRLLETALQSLLRPTLASVAAEAAPVDRARLAAENAQPARSVPAAAPAGSVATAGPAAPRAGAAAPAGGAVGGAVPAAPAAPVAAAATVAAAPTVAGVVTLDALRGELQTYSQRHGIENARRLMTRLGFGTVSQVPEQRRGEVIAAIHAAIELPGGAPAVQA